MPVALQPTSRSLKTARPASLIAKPRTVALGESEIP